MITLNNGEVVGSMNSDDKILAAKLLVNAMNALGHSLSYEEVRNYPSLPRDPNIYAVYFGSLKKACVEAWHYSEVEVYQKQQISCSEVAARGRELASINLQLEMIDRNTKVRWFKMEKREVIVKRAAELCQSHNNDVSWLTEEHIKKDPDLPRFKEIVSVFGSLNKFKKAVRKYLNDEVYKYKIDGIVAEETKSRQQEYETAEPSKQELPSEFDDNQQEQAIDDTQNTQENGEPVSKSSKRRRTSDEEIISGLLAFYQKNNCLPKPVDCPSNILPSFATITNHLGPKSGWGAIIGIEDKADDKHEDSDIVIDEDPNNPTDEETEELEDDYETDCDISEENFSDYDEETDEADEDDDIDEVDDNVPFIFEFSNDSINIYISLLSSENVNIRITEH